MVTAVTGYFVAQEFGYVAVDRGRLRQQADAGDKAAQRALKVTERLSFVLSGAQLGITVTALLVGYVAEPFLGDGLADVLGVAGVPAAVSLPLSIVFALLVATVVQMVLGELAPKNLAIARSEGLAKALEPLHADLPGGLRADHPALRHGGRTAAAPARHRADRGAARGRHPRGPRADHRRVPGRGSPRRRGVAAARPGPGLPAAHRRRGHGAAGGRAHGTCRRARPAGSSSCSTPAVRASRCAAGDGVDEIIGVVGIADVLEVPPAERATTAVSTLDRRPRCSCPPRCGCRPCWTGCAATTASSPASSTSTAASPGSSRWRTSPRSWSARSATRTICRNRPRNAPDDGSWVVPARWRIDEVVDATGMPLPEDADYDTVSGLVMARLGRVPLVGDMMGIELPGQDLTGDEPDRVGSR